MSLHSACCSQKQCEGYPAVECPWCLSKTSMMHEELHCRLCPRHHPESMATNAPGKREQVRHSCTVLMHY